MAYNNTVSPQTESLPWWRALNLNAARAMMVFLCDSIESSVPRIRLQRHGDDEWTVVLDCGSKLRLTIAELYSYTRFRMLALLQAERLFPPMSDLEWHVIVAQAVRRASHAVLRAH